MREGITGRAETFVTKDNTAEVMGSGNLPVYATPAVVALMEQACYRSVVPELEDGTATVGVHMDINHIAATSLGKKVWAESRLTAVDGRKLTFEAEAYDEDRCIAKAVHERMIIDVDRFMSRL